VEKRRGNEREEEDLLTNNNELLPIGQAQTGRVLGGIGLKVGV
jgi:hypothetical protein